MRLTCPDCKNAELFDDADAGREVECPRCRGTIRLPDATPPGEGGTPGPRFDDADGRPWRGRGVSSMVLGLLSVPSALCCGLGGLFAIGGFVLGAISLRTPSRGAAITGVLTSAVGGVLSLGVLAVFFTLQAAVNKPVAPAVEGMQPPFAKKL